MSITLEQLSARMRQGEQVPLRHTAQVALTLSIPSILQQIVRYSSRCASSLAITASLRFCVPEK